MFDIFMCETILSVENASIFTQYFLHFRVDFDLLSSSIVDTNPALVEQLGKLKNLANKLQETVVGCFNVHVQVALIYRYNCVS